MHTTSWPVDNWFVDKYRGKKDVLGFGDVYMELRSLFGQIKTLLNEQPVQVGQVEFIIQKVVYLVRSTKDVITTKNSASLSDKMDAYFWNIRSFVMEFAAKAENWWFQVGMFDTTLDHLGNVESTFLVDSRLVYHNYNEQVAQALTVEKKPYSRMSTEYLGNREKLSKQERLDYFSMNGPSNFGIEGDLTPATLGKYYFLSDVRSVGPISGKTDRYTLPYQKVFHYYVGLCKLLQVIDKKYSNNKVAAWAKTVDIKEFTNTMILDTLPSYVKQHVSESDAHEEQIQASTMTFLIDYRASIVELLNAIFPN